MVDRAQPSTAPSPAELGAISFIAWARSVGLARDGAITLPLAPLPPQELRAITAFEIEERFVTTGVSDAVTMLEAWMRHRGPASGRRTQLLDFGCGCGRLTRYLTLADHIGVSGVDVNPRLVRWCQEFLPRARILQSDVEPPLHIADGAFDCVVAMSVFTHLAGDAASRWLGDLARVLRPGGLLLASCHGYNSPLELVEYLPGAVRGFQDLVLMRKGD